jgi:hypothetical protein
MLSPRDAALLEAYARECEDSARAASIESARAHARLSVDIQRRDDQNFRSLVRGRLPNQAAQARGPDVCTRHEALMSRLPNVNG